MKISNKTLDLTGQMFGKWTVVEFAGYKGRQGRTTWLCRCECGGKSIVPTGNLRSGRSTQCKKCASLKGGNRSITKEYHIWKLIEDDCCDTWKSFDIFIRDMGTLDSKIIKNKKIKQWLRKKDLLAPHGPDNSFWKPPINGNLLQKLKSVQTISARQDVIKEARNMGYTFAEIGIVLSVRRQRVSQILKYQQSDKPVGRPRKER